MKLNFIELNLLTGITLLIISNSILGVEAETINYSKCEKINTCATLIPKQEIAKSSILLKNSEQVKNNLPDGKISTVGALTTKSQGNAATIRTPENLISQFGSMTNSNGDRIFRSTRSGPSYIGVAANFGLNGNSDLGGRSLVIISKFGLNEIMSIRPSALILGKSATFLLPITYDFDPQQAFGNFKFSPYLGGGVAITTGSNSSYGAMITGGIDIPWTSTFTINMTANIAFLDTTDFGVLVGIGYNF
ncbi:MAG: hypothetical protein WCP16_18900 [Pseudanabaena sp. ELA645]|jgi:hypothetical protein